MQLFGFSGPWRTDEAGALERYVRTQAGGDSSPPAPGGIPAGDGGCLAPHLSVEPDLIVALRGEPIWLAAPDVPAAQPARAVAIAYRRWGRSFLDRLHGSFALAVIDRRSNDVLLAIDRMGIESLAYALSGEGVVFGSTCGGVARFPGLKVALRKQALLDYFLMHMIPSPGTVFEGVRKLEPGTSVGISGGRSSAQRYWSPAFSETVAGSVADLETELHASLRQAVEACKPDQNTGAFLSGGLDSSTVAGVLATVSKGPARTFSIGFGVDAYNELEVARHAVRRFGFNAVEYHVTSDDVVTALPLIARAYEEPFGNSSAVPTYFCAKVAADHGISHLLAGDGGDELFGGNERYAKQGIFEAYLRLPRVLRKGLIEPITDSIREEHPFMPLRKFRSYVNQARTPLPERFEYWNFMHRADISLMLDPRFQAAVDRRAPLRLMEEVYVASNAQSLLNRMLFYDWHFTLADNDLRKVGTMCALAGIKVSYPMLDPRVVDLSLRVPSRIKMEGSELRSFYKKAMRDFLPREILEKSKHGFGLPFGVWLKTDARLADLIFSLLSDLKSRRIVRAEFLDQLIREQRAGDASFFGYAIWDLAMLEAWLNAHAPSFSV